MFSLLPDSPGSCSRTIEHFRKHCLVNICFSVSNKQCNTQELRIISLITQAMEIPFSRRHGVKHKSRDEYIYIGITITVIATVSSQISSRKMTFVMAKGNTFRKLTTVDGASIHFLFAYQYNFVQHSKIYRKSSLQLL